MEKIYSYILSQIPDSIDFDFITVKNETIKHIYLDNISEQSILFNIENGEGFIFEPTNGIIPKKKKLEIKIKIQPDFAKVLVSNAQIILEQKYSKIIKLSSVSKYPYITLNKNMLDFGTIQIGKTTEQELIITNLETVPAHFTIERTSTQPGKQPCSFYISNLTGDIPPKSNFLLKILFKPMFPQANYHEIFCLSTRGGNKLTFSCKGFCKTLKTWVGTKYVNFGTIPLGTQIKKLFRIYNDSDLATEFQIYHDNNGAFSFDHTEGIIPARTNIRINVTFRPYETIIYYQRIFCIIKNHMLFSIDLFGSCHDLLTKTPLLDMKQIELFRYKQLKGIFLNNNISDKNTKNDFYESKFIKTISNFDDTNNDFKKNFANSNQQQPQLHKELFWETVSKTRLISFDTDLIDFGYIQSGTVSEPYILNITNNSNEDIKVKFIYEKPINLSNLIKTINIFHAENTVFFTQPEEIMIPRKGSSMIKVYFKPNKSEYYFYENLPCQATIIKFSPFKNNNQNSGFSTIKNNKQQLSDINKNKLSDFGKGMLTKKNDFTKTIFGNTKNNNSIIKSFTLTATNYETHQRNETKNIFSPKKSDSNFSFSPNPNINPPFTSYISLVGHSFPPGTQIFMPMFELSPKKEIFFPPTTINQSLYQTLKIENKNDTPLFYKINPDPEGIFRIYSKYGLIPSHSFHLICLEFSPKDTTIYRFPLNIKFNHDSQNTKTIMLNGLCTDPVIDIEKINKEIYFPPCYVGIKRKKTVNIRNLSPIKILVKIKIENSDNGTVEVDEDSFEMDLNSIKKIDFYLTPNKTAEIISHVIITAERTYDPTNENIGIYNPENLQNTKNKLYFDKRIFTKEFRILGMGSDGNLSIKPNKLEFGTVKVGFHKKLSFSVYNPTITNFYIKIVPDYSGNLILPQDKNLPNPYTNRSDISFDITEGILNSFCKKDINIKFEPKTRACLSFKVNIYTTDTLKNLEKVNHTENDELKCTLEITAKGDYPLIKIVDLRNNIISPSKLWKDFNVDMANEELQKKLTDEEISYSNAKSNKKIDDITQKLKLIRFDFGKKFISKNKPETQIEDVYLTLKNEGGVLSEFFFKFPDDISIKREIWMDPVEPTSNDKVEYHVLKEKIFTIEPRKSKIGPGESCNIRLRYNIKERGIHRLRVLFQVVNGKPLIFELYGETLSDKIGILEIPTPIFKFSNVPIGYMDYITSPIEIRNISSVKIKYSIDYNEIKKFNELSDGFEIFKLENIENSIGPGETKYIIAHFRPLTNMTYKLNLILHYTDDINVGKEKITIIGHGYHPLKYIPEKLKSSFEKMPSAVVFNNFNGQIIQKCGLNIDELNFGAINKPKNKTFIIYNYSKENSLNFDFHDDPSFLNKDILSIVPNKGLIEANSHKIIKCVLTPRENLNNEYEGDVLIRITWNAKAKNEFNSTIIDNASFSNKAIPRNKFTNTLGTNFTSNILNGPNKVQKENLFLRVVKNCDINLDNTKKTLNLKFINLNVNSSFVEIIINKLVQDILSSKNFIECFSKNIDNQPLSLYQWSSNEIISDIGEVRGKYLKNLSKSAENQINDINNVSNSYKRTGARNEMRSMSKKYSYKDVEDIEQGAKKINFNAELENQLGQKLIMDLINKYKYSIREVNEKLIMVNEESKKLISDIVMENTIYNIICEAVYGEIDLTEKQRIYFFLNGENKRIIEEEGKEGNNTNKKIKSMET